VVAGQAAPAGAGPERPAARGLGTPLRASGLPGAGPIARRGARIGLLTVRDLLLWLPRRYDDLRTIHDAWSLRTVEPDTVVTVLARVVSVRVGRTARRRVEVVTAHLADSVGSLEARWYGRQFVERRLLAGAEFYFSGKVRRRGPEVYLDNPAFQSPESDLVHVARIVPVYRLTEGVALRSLRSAIRAALDRFGPYPEYLPAELLAAERLTGIGQALEQAHFPDDFAGRDEALRRLAFDELLALQVGMVARRRQRAVAAAVRVAVPEARAEAIRRALTDALSARMGRPVQLTDDQQGAMDAVRRDLAGAHPMLRLLQGDVGSGKTLVAAYALALVAEAGFQGALLAPTDLLARQHAATLGELLAPLGLPVTLLTGSLSAAGARTALAAVADGRAAVVVGTHALFSERVAYARLGLVVVDEQHRFGVEQRGALDAKTVDGAAHVLLMTATPIPRTLGQVLYADLDVSDLRAVPAGRRPTRTAIRRPHELDRLWEFVRREAELGRRTFVVVPRVDVTDGEGDDEVATAVAEATRVAALLPTLRVGLVHGRLRPADRDQEMGRFRDGEIDVLVATTVVEVGVDVPEATIMIVEGADRFGLAQLHQLRGRVGRGEHQSYCILVTSAAEDAVALERLRAVEASTDGFELAERDFELRREGDVLGLAQSGLPRLRVATLTRGDHRALAAAARRHAESLVDDEGRLSGAADPLVQELTSGWLARVFAAEAASGA
jgi:ATP-dependent DNA helicase RecG